MALEILPWNRSTPEGLVPSEYPLDDNDPRGHLRNESARKEGVAKRSETERTHLNGVIEVRDQEDSAKLA